MGRYEWTGPRPFHDHANGRTIDPDEVADVDDDVAADFAAFVAVEAEGDTDDSGTGSADGEPEDADDESGGDVPLDLSEHTIPELEDELATGEYDDELHALLDAEKAGEDRGGGKQAIEDRMDEA